MNREQLNKMDVNVTHNLSSKENSPERGKEEKHRDFYFNSFSNSANAGIRR